MADLSRPEMESADAQSGELNDLIDHWIQLIDGWVQELDQRMGGTADGADPGGGSPPDSAPRPAPDAPPAVGTG